MISTSSLFIFYITKTSIESVSGYGAKLHIGNPEMLITIFWFCWGYFFIRYYQAFNDYGSSQFRNKYSELLKINYIKHLGVDTNNISDFGFIDKLVINIEKKNDYWQLSAKMKDEGESLPYFIHHGSEKLSSKQVKKLRKNLKLLVLLRYPHFIEYIFPLIFSAALPLWFFMR